MSITTDQINVWRSVSTEHQRLEFKEAKTQIDFGKLCKYCVALANEGGGPAVLGVVFYLRDNPMMKTGNSISC